MPAGLHPFVQAANNLDHAGLHGAIVHDVYGLLNETRAAILTGMSPVKAAYRNRAIASAAASGPCWDKTAHVGVEVRLLNLHELAALQCIDAGLELGAQRFSA